MRVLVRYAPLDEACGTPVWTGACSLARIYLGNLATTGRKERLEEESDYPMAIELPKSISFECLHCGKASKVEKLQTLQPRCGKCGSGTGVIGDIGEGTLTSRLRRNFRIGGEYGKDPSFECLTCGESTKLETIYVLRPECSYCGAKSGLLVERTPGGEIGAVVAAGLAGLLARNSF